MVFKGRVFAVTELELVREVVSRYRGLSRQELANTACELPPAFQSRLEDGAPRSVDRLGP